MDVVGSGLDAGVDDGAGGMAELRGIVAGLELELGQGIGRRVDDVAGAVGEVHHVGVVVHAVEDEVILFGALAVGVEIAAAATAGAGGQSRAGSQLGNKDPIAAAEGNVIDFFRGHGLANGTVLGLHDGSFGGDRNGFGGGAGLEGDDHAEALLNAQVEVGLGGGFKVGRAGRQGVVADFDGRRYKPRRRRFWT